MNSYIEFKQRKVKMVSLNIVKQEALELPEEEQDNLAAYLTVLRLRRNKDQINKLTSIQNASRRNDWVAFEDSSRVNEL